MGQVQGDIKDQLTFDCSIFKKLDPDAKDYMKKSAKGRQRYCPQIVYLVTTMYKNYKQFVVAEESKVADNDVRSIVCHYSHLEDLTTTDFVSRLVKSLSIPRSRRRRQNADKYLRTVADQFKAPLPYFVKMKYGDCL